MSFFLIMYLLVGPRSAQYYPSHQWPQYSTHKRTTKIKKKLIKRNNVLNKKRKKEKRKKKKGYKIKREEWRCLICTWSFGLYLTAKTLLECPGVALIPKPRPPTKKKKIFSLFCEDQYTGVSHVFSRYYHVIIMT